MSLFIRKNPNPQTLLSKVYAAEYPAGYEASTEEAADAWVAAQLAAGWIPAPVQPSPEEQAAKLAAACSDLSQARLDGLAQSWGYDSIVSLVSYKGDANPRFDAEGSAGFAARSAEWTAADEFRAAALAGQVAPTLENYVSALPALPVRPVV